MALETLLKMFNFDGTDCEFLITSFDRQGRISIHRGELIDAECGDLAGEEAVYRLLSWPEQSVEFGPLPKGRPRRIDVPLAILLMESVLHSVPAQGSGSFDVHSAFMLDRLEMYGHLTGLPVEVILNVLSQEQASAALDISAGRQHGQLALRNGELIDAVFENFDGEAAFRQILAWSDPVVAFGSLPATIARRIETPLAVLLLELSQQTTTLANGQSDVVKRANPPVAAQSRARYDFVTWQPLEMVLSLLHQEAADCTLHVLGVDKDGWMLVEQGKVVEANQADLSGEDAAFEMLSWIETRIEISARSSATPRKSELPVPEGLHGVTPYDATMQDIEGDAGEAVTPAVDIETPVVSEAGEQVAIDAIAVPEAPLLDDRATVEPSDEAAPCDTVLDVLPVLEIIRHDVDVELARIVSDPRSETLLADAQAIGGYAAAAVLDGQHQRVLGSHVAVGEPPFDALALPMLDFLGIAEHDWLQTGTDEVIEEAVITFNNQYHLINIVDPNQSTFLYLILDRGAANLAMARRRLATICTLSPEHTNL
jgi:hypothetical protein